MKYFCVFLLLRSVAEKVRPTRALFVPFKHGYPLDTPGDSRRQHAVIEAALQLFEDPALTAPVLRDYIPPQE
ncbi:MAG: hypothetical protein ABH969_08190 [Pseudomonadota bacterium]